MIVNRRTFRVKWGRVEEAVALMKAEGKRVGFPHALRLYTNYTGPFSTIAFEAEFENLEEYERWWAEYFASPEGAAFNGKFLALLEAGGTNEIWNLEE